METQIDRRILIRRALLFLLLLIAAAAIMIANIRYNQKRVSVANDKVGFVGCIEPGGSWGISKYLVIVFR